MSGNANKSPAHYPPLRVAWLVWGLSALFYLMGFFQRVVPAVMTSELMHDFHISATGLGNLSAFYFYSYVAMQIPTGILADRWGPRRLLAMGALIAGGGTLLFALSTQILWASVGRLLIGGSVAVAFVGLLKLTSNWFPVRFYSMATGMALLVGIVGAVFAGPPLRLLMNLYSWRSIMFVSAIITFLMGLSIWFFVRDLPHEKGYKDLHDTGMHSKENRHTGIVKGIGTVFTYANVVLLFIIPGGIVGCVLTFSGLWGVPFLTHHHNLSPEQAAALSSTLLVAWAVGGPFFGWLSDRLGYRKPIYIAGALMTVLGWLGIVFLNPLTIGMLTLLLVITGFFSGCMIISFAFGKESVPQHLSGTVSGVINMGVMMGPTIMQPTVGWILDRTWAGSVAGGIRIYSLHSFQSGFSLMIGWAALSFILLFFTRETHCRQME